MIYYFRICQVIRHSVEDDIYIVARDGHRGSAHRLQLGVLAVVDRNADVHSHGAEVQTRRRRFAVRVAVSRHVPVTNAGFLHGRPDEQAKNYIDDHIQKDVEYDIHVGRRCRSGRTRLLHGKPYVNHYHIRIHRGHRVFVKRRICHKQHGSVAKLRRNHNGNNQYGFGICGNLRSFVRRVHHQRRGEYSDFYTKLSYRFDRGSGTCSPRATMIIL